ncbi:M67 family metallopeptidase [Melioribacteraceae bacterium 4301-Me]|uniref:M67 family metallopeptidase n=1 Tax=Pyranulibacter aquaticus TaxID=3163344 RepID=UPI003595063C
MTIKIPKKIINKIVEHGKKDFPIEACGYLIGNGDTVTDIIYMTNIDKSNEHFTFDPKEQFKALKYAREKGEKLLAVYHSHPNSPARMSNEDIRLANDTSMKYLIYSVVDDKINCFIVDKDKNVEKIEIVVL